MADNPAELLDARRSEIEASMAQHLTGSLDDAPSPEDSDAARHLVGILIASLRGSEEMTSPRAAKPVAQRYYSQFGDGLSPVLKDVLGTEADAALLAGAIDGYWRAVRAQA